MAYIVLKKV